MENAEMTNRRAYLDIVGAVKKYALTFISVIAALISFGICLYYILYPSQGYFHSDCTDSLLWANATVESGKVFDENFRYAAMLPFSSSLWYIPLISVFGMTMDVQLAGMAIFLVLFTAAIYFMCRSFGWSIASSCGMISALLLGLSGSDKLREIMWGHVIYYSLALIVICVALGLCQSLSKDLESEKISASKSIIFAALIAVLFAGNATNGFQVIAISTLPVIAAIFAERFFDGKTKLFSKKNLPAAANLVLIVVATALGLVLLKILKGDKIANYTSIYSTFSGVSDWYGNFANFFEDYLTLIGVNASRGSELFSKESIPYLIRMVGGALILVLPAVRLCTYKSIRERSTKILLWTHIAMSAVIMVGFICGRLSNANWRLTPMVGTAIMSTVAIIREFFGDLKEHPVEFRLAAVLCSVLVLVCAVNAAEIRKMPKDYGQDNYLHVLASDLEERGLEYGYATFWRSQAITVISDSKVKCRETLVNSNGIITDYYQSSRLWYEDQPGIDKYFVILSASEYETAQETAHWDAITSDGSLVEQFTSGGCYVFVFNRNIILQGEFNG